MATITTTFEHDLKTHLLLVSEFIHMKWIIPLMNSIHR